MFFFGSLPGIGGIAPAVKELAAWLHGYSTPKAFPILVSLVHDFSSLDMAVMICPAPPTLFHFRFLLLLWCASNSFFRCLDRADYLVRTSPVLLRDTASLLSTRSRLSLSLRPGTGRINHSLPCACEHRGKSLGCAGLLWASGGLKIPAFLPQSKLCSRHAEFFLLFLKLSPFYPLLRLPGSSQS